MFDYVDAAVDEQQHPVMTQYRLACNFPRKEFTRVPAARACCSASSPLTAPCALGLQESDADKTLAAAGLTGSVALLVTTV